jgi:hypothetical protein
MSRRTTLRRDGSKANCKTGIPLWNPQTSLNEMDETNLYRILFLALCLFICRSCGAYRLTQLEPGNEKLEDELGFFLIIAPFFGGHIMSRRID